MDTIIIKIIGMKEAACIPTIANVMQDLPHIGAIEISLERAEARVEHGRLIEVGDIPRAIADAGYRAAC